MELLQVLMVKPSDKVAVRWDIGHTTSYHPFIQEDIDDSGLKNSQRFSIILSGMNDEGTAWSPCIRQPYCGKDWSTM